MHRAKGGAKPSLLPPGPVLILLLRIPKSSSNIAEPPLKTVHLAKCPLWTIVEPMTAPKGLKFCWGSSVQFSCSVMSDSLQPHGLQHCLSITNSQSLLKLMSIESVMPSNHLVLSHPIILPSIFPSIRVFSNESALHIRWPKYWSFSFNISPSSEYSVLISFRTDWFDLLAVQGNLKSLLQHDSSKATK